VVLYATKLSTALNSECNASTASITCIAKKLLWSSEIVKWENRRVSEYLWNEGIDRNREARSIGNGRCCWNGNSNGMRRISREGARYAYHSSSLLILLSSFSFCFCFLFYFQLFFTFVLLQKKKLLILWSKHPLLLYTLFRSMYMGCLDYKSKVFVFSYYKIWTLPV